MIRKYLVFSLLAGALAISGCTPKKDFKSDVDTKLKPWTNLDFYNEPSNFQFAIVSDRNGGMRRGIFEKGVEKINLLMPEFVMCVGDLIDGYTTDTALISQQWDEFNQIISGLKMPFFYLPGNHDITNEVMQKEWEKRYGKRYYSFTYKNVLFMVLDSNDDKEFSISREQTDYVKKTLNENSKVKWTYLFMHHPIWNYKTDGRFQEIQAELQNRKHTVIAGHEHRYLHEEINSANYYILATTGGGSALMGEPFGQFDHISWITMSDNGPVMANLKLDGILTHDVTNKKIRTMAEHLVANSKMQHVMLCNPGTRFSNGTLYLKFANPSETDMLLNLDIYHHHQLQIQTPDAEIIIPAGDTKQVEIPFYSFKPIEYDKIDLIITNWQIRYKGAENKNFALQGKSQFSVSPTKTEFISKKVNSFIGNTQIEYHHPFNNLAVVYSASNSKQVAYIQPLAIDKSTALVFQLKNNKNEISGGEHRNFEKIEFKQPVIVANPEPGLKYRYYENEWETFPDFTNLSAVKNGLTKDFEVSELANREDNWALVYTGFIKINEDNLYIFRVNADEGCRFYINNELICDEATKLFGEHVGVAALKKGFHPVRIEFFEKQGNQRLRFYVKNDENDAWNSMNENWFYTEK